MEINIRRLSWFPTWLLWDSREMAKNRGISHGNHVGNYGDGDWRDTSRSGVQWSLGTGTPKNLYKTAVDWHWPVTMHDNVPASWKQLCLSVTQLSSKLMIHATSSERSGNSLAATGELQFAGVPTSTSATYEKAAQQSVRTDEWRENSIFDVGRRVETSPS